jgi:hypothetical protein
MRHLFNVQFHLMGKVQYPVGYLANSIEDLLNYLGENAINQMRDVIPVDDDMPLVLWEESRGFVERSVREWIDRTPERDVVLYMHRIGNRP